MRRLIPRRLLLPFLVAALAATPFSVWSDQGASGGQGKTEAQEKAEMAAAAKVTIHDAIKAATQKVQGKVIEAELEEKPRVTWEVEVLTDDGKIMEVWVDVDTGSVVAVEEEKAEQEAAQPPANRPMGGMMHRGCGMSPCGGQEGGPRRQ